MSRFYASIRGSRGEATRQGTVRSGIHGHIRGWDLGIEVEGHCAKDGPDCFDVYVTGGTHGYSDRKLVLRVTYSKDGDYVLDHVRL